MLIFPLYAFWVPQIVFCVRHDVRQPLRPAYVVGITLTRLALPLYLFGCPRNLLGWQPRPGVCLGLCACMALQVGAAPGLMCALLVQRLQSLRQTY